MVKSLPKTVIGLYFELECLEPGLSHSQAWIDTDILGGLTAAWDGVVPKDLQA